MIPGNNLMPNDRMGLPLRITAPRALTLFACLWLFCWILGLLIVGVINSGGESRLTLAIIVQDVVMFMFPLMCTAYIASPKPLSYMGLDRKPHIFALWTSVFTLIVAIPAVNRIVEWNQSIHLPQSMATIEAALRSFEESAGGMIQMLIGDGSVGDLILAILMMGCLTGVAEEMFFRGGLQSALMRRFNSPHVAVWLTAIVFSAIHMQFFGFVPRVLLGAFFGYLYLWSGTLWLPIIAHALNNSLVVISMWTQQRGIGCPALDTLGAGSGIGDIILAIISAAMAYISLWFMWRHIPRMRGLN